MTKKETSPQADVLSAEQEQNTRSKLADEVAVTQRELKQARKLYAQANKLYDAAEKESDKAWKAHERSAGGSTKKAVDEREAWEKAHVQLDRARSRRFGAFDRVDRLEKILVKLQDPSTLEQRLKAKEKATIERSRTGTEGNQKEKNMAARSNKLSAIDAVIEVLRKAGGPMKMPDIIAAAVPMTALRGEHPGQTIYSVVYSENKKPNSRVKQVGRGEFRLASARGGNGGNGSQAKTDPKPSKKTAAASKRGTASKSRAKTAAARSSSRGRKTGNAKKRAATKR